MGQSNVSGNKSDELKSSVELKTVLMHVCNTFASMRTVKNLTSDVKTFSQRLGDVCDTIEAIRSTSGFSVTINGDSYQIQDYAIPKALIDYVSAGRIYASQDAIESAEPLIRVGVTEAKLSPLAFNKFFSDFNKDQAEEFKIPVATDWAKRTSVTLEDVQYLKDESGRLAKLHEGGMDICTCDLIGLRIEGLCSFLKKYDEPNMDGFASWLFKA